MTKSVAKYLSLHFEGHFLYRIATDPDPSDDRRGTSGYTMALQGEPNLDQIIRLQSDEKLREPASYLGIEIGVKVNNVTYDGQLSKEGTALLKGAKIDFVDTDPVSPYHGVTFVSWNNVVGSDDTLAFVVEPFEISVTQKLEGQDFGIYAKDNLDPADPSKRAWEIAQPRLYSRRLPTNFEAGSAEAHQAIGVYDEYGYFRDRRRWLTQQMDRLRKSLGAAQGQDRDELAQEIQNYQSRLYQIEAWGNRVTNKLGFLCQWDFLINGRQMLTDSASGMPNNWTPTAPGESTLEKALGITIEQENQMWPVRFWFGGWDGDLLTGYMRGTLDLPAYKAGESVA